MTEAQKTLFNKPDNSEHVVQRSKAVSGAGAPDEIRTLIFKSLKISSI
ncbi:hypothetical protein ACFE6N_16640 [Pedobacter sp. BG31]